MRRSRLSRSAIRTFSNVLMSGWRAWTPYCTEGSKVKWTGAFGAFDCSADSWWRPGSFAYEDRREDPPCARVSGFPWCSPSPTGTGALSTAVHGPPPAHRGSAGDTHPWPAGRPSQLRTFPRSRDLHRRRPNLPTGSPQFAGWPRRSSHTRPRRVRKGTRFVVTAQKSFPGLAAVLVDEAPAPARSGEDRWTTRWRYPSGRCGPRSRPELPRP